MLKKILLISILYLGSIFINSCCNKTEYNTTIQNLTFPGTMASVKGSGLTLKFTLTHEFSELAHVDLISSAKADAIRLKCGDVSKYIKYSDPISKITFTCNKDLIGFKAGEDLSANIQTKYSLGNYVSQFQLTNLARNLNSENGMPAEVFIVLYLPIEAILTDGSYQFQLTFTTTSGKIFEANTNAINWEK